MLVHVSKMVLLEAFRLVSKYWCPTAEVVSFVRSPLLDSVKIALVLTLRHRSVRFLHLHTKIVLPNRSECKVRQCQMRYRTLCNWLVEIEPACFDRTWNELLHGHPLETKWLSWSSIVVSEFRSLWIHQRLWPGWEHHSEQSFQSVRPERRCQFHGLGIGRVVWVLWWRVCGKRNFWAYSRIIEFRLSIFPRNSRILVGQLTYHCTHGVLLRWSKREKLLLIVSNILLGKSHFF